MRERRDAAAVDGGAQGEEDQADHQVQEQEERTPHQPHRLHLQQGRPSRYTVHISVPDPNPDPPDPNVFGPPGSGSFYQQAKIVRKTWIPTVCGFFWTF